MKLIRTLTWAGAFVAVCLQILQQAHADDALAPTLTYMGKELKRTDLKAISEVTSRPRPGMTRYLTVTRHPYNGCGSAPGQVEKNSNVDCPDVREVDTAGGKKTFFNNTCGVEPQEVVISGYEVHFQDSGEWHQLWDRLNSGGKPVGNIARLVVYADKVVVSSPLKVPGGDVVVHARELVFEQNGSLDTTPTGNFEACDLKSAAWCKDNAAPTIQEINGELRQACPDRTLVFRDKGDDGIDGSRGGDITLAVDKVNWGTGKSPRLFTSGGQGSRGGLGLDGLHGTSLPVVGEEVWKRICPNNECNKFWDTNVNNIPNITYWNFTIGSGANKKVVPAATRGTPLWPTSGHDALREGRPASGGDCGVIYGDTIDARNIYSESGEHATPTKMYYIGGAAKQCGNSQSCDISHIESSNAFILSMVLPHIGGFRGPRSFIEDQNTLKKWWSNNSSITTKNVTVGKWANTYLVKGTKFRNGSCPALKAMPTAQPLHPLQLLPVIEYVKDLYLSGHDGKALEITKRYLGLIEAVPADRREAFAASEQELSGLKLRLESGLDYFGNPFGYVPNLSFATLVSQYQDQAKRFSKGLALGLWMQRQDWELKKTSDHFTELVTQLQSQVEADSNAFDSAQTKLGELTALASDVSIKQNAVDQELLNREQELAAEAQKHMDEKHRKQQDAFKSFLNTVAKVAKVIPVYQPALGMAASAVEMATNDNQGSTVDLAVGLFSTYNNLSDPEVKQASMASVQQFGDQIRRTGGAMGGGVQQAWQGIQGVDRALLERYGAAVKADYTKVQSGFTMDRMATTLKTFKNGEVVENINNFTRDKKHSFNQVGQGISQFHKGLKEMEDRFGQLQGSLSKAMNDQISQRAPMSEVQAELEKLKVEDEKYLETKKLLMELLQKKAMLYQQYAESVNSLHELSTNLRNGMTELNVSANARDNAIAAQDHELSLRVRAMTQRTRDRMLHYLYDLSKAYEYFMVQPSPVDLDVVRLSDKLLDQLFPPNTAAQALDQEKAVESIRTLFDDNENKLREQLNSLTMKHDEVVLSLTEQEKADLYKSGRIEVNLGERLTRITENLNHERHKGYGAFRVQNVSVSYVSFNKDGRYNIEMIPGGESVLSDAGDYSGTRLFYFRHCVMGDKLSCKTGASPIVWPISLGVDPNGKTYNDSLPPMADAAKSALCAAYNQTLTNCNWDNWVALPSLFDTLSLKVTSIDRPNFKDLVLRVRYFWISR